MDTWETVREHLRDRFHLSVDTPEGVNLVWRFEGAAGPTLQRQYVEPTRVAGRPALLIVCDVLGADRLDPWDALRHNLRLGVGALAVVEDTYVLRAVFELDGPGESRLDESLELVAHEAARVREVLVGRPAIDDLAAFDLWSEGADS